MSGKTINSSPKLPYHASVDWVSVRWSLRLFAVQKVTWFLLAWMLYVWKYRGERLRRSRPCLWFFLVSSSENTVCILNSRDGVPHGEQRQRPAFRQCRPLSLTCSFTCGFDLSTPALLQVSWKVMEQRSSFQIFSMSTCWDLDSLVLTLSSLFCSCDTVF